MLVRIRNWAKYQHYKDRRPRWIKLHFHILSSKDWACASDSERVLAIACMLIASQSETDDASFDADPDYFQRVAYLQEKPDFGPLIERGFLEIVSSASKPYQALAEFRPEREKETEKEREKEIEKKNQAHPLRTPEFLKFMKEYPNQLNEFQAWKEWAHIPFVDKQVEQILAGLARWKLSDAWNDERFIPAADKFLKDKRWEKNPPRPAEEGKVSERELERVRALRR